MAVMETEYENIRDNVAPGLAALSDEQLRAVLAQNGMDAEAMEGFFDDLGKFASSAGKAVLKAAPSILPVAGSIVGTAFGGPIGAQIGGSLGSLAGKAVGAATGQPAAGGAGGGGLGGLLSGGLGSLLGGGGSPAAGGAGLGGLLSGGLGSLLGGGGSPAAGQLLQTITKPETMQALTSMAMGAMGKPNVSVGGTQVPVGAFGNLLKTLLGQAEAEYAEAMSSAEGDGTPAYMKDFSGQAVSDPAVPLNRAVALYNLLQTYGAPVDAEASDAEADAEAAEQEAMQAEYDEMELMEIYEAEDA